MNRFVDRPVSDFRYFSNLNFDIDASETLRRMAVDSLSSHNIILKYSTTSDRGYDSCFYLCNPEIASQFEKSCFDQNIRIPHPDDYDDDMTIFLHPNFDYMRSIFDVDDIERILGLQ